MCNRCRGYGSTWLLRKYGDLLVDKIRGLMDGGGLEGLLLELFCSDWNTCNPMMKDTPQLTSILLLIIALLLDVKIPIYMADRKLAN